MACELFCLWVFCFCFLFLPVFHSAYGPQPGGYKMATVILNIMSSPSNVQRWWGRRRHVPPLASLFKEKLFSCIPQLTYPYVLLVARFTDCKPQTNHCQRGWNDIAWIHPNLCPWGCRGPRSPEAHSSLIFYQNGERMSAGESTNSVCHTRKKYLEKALFKCSVVSGPDLVRFVFWSFLMSLI